MLAHTQFAQLAGFGTTEEDTAVALRERGIEALNADISARIRDGFNL